MLKKTASFVLARSEPATYLLQYVLALHFAAALLGGLFEHPAASRHHIVITDVVSLQSLEQKRG
jgi:hypothetical protein